MNTGERLANAGHYLTARLLEPSTWRGLILIVSAGSWAAMDSSSKGEFVMQCGLIIAGVVQTILPQNVLYNKHNKKDGEAKQP